MVKFKMELGLLCVLLLSSFSGAVVNKASEQQETSVKEEDSHTAEDRISNSYGPPNNNVNNPPPVYGPPELTGDYRPPQEYPPPPPEQLPPISSSYNGPLPQKPAIPFTQPSPTYGAPPSGPPKPTYGPPKQRYGPPKLGRPPFPFSSFRQQKPKYGPPNFNKLGSGPQIPLSLEAYGPPVSKPSSFNVPHKEYVVPHNQYGPPPAISNQYGPPLPSNQYRPPPLPSNQYGPPQNQYRPPVPQSQYGPPSASQQFAPPLPSIPAPPPPGVPAPPTPPDIKYDGWQPIAGNINIPKNPEISNAYGPPEKNSEAIPANTYGPPNVIQGPPANTYGPPAEIYGPPENIQGPPADTYGPSAQSYGPPADTYGPPTNNVDQSLLPPLNLNTADPSKVNVPSDSYGAPLNNPDAQNFKFSVAPDSENGLPPPQLPQVEPLHVGKGPGDTEINQHSNYNGFDSARQNTETLPVPNALVGDNLSGGHHGDFTEQQLPNLPPVQFNQPQQLLPSSAPPRPFNSHGSSVQNDGLSLTPPQGPGNRGPGFYFNSGSSYGKFGNFFNGKSIRPQQPTLADHNTPPRPRPPIKFKDSVPSSMFSALNRFIPPGPNVNFGKPQKNYGPPVEPQLPNLSPPVNFHSNGASFESQNNLGLSALAAPNVNYGTPLSFGDFNTPTPLLTYGAPNFGPVAPLVPEVLRAPGNLYNNINAGLPNIYGTPLTGSSLFGFENSCNFLDHSSQLNLPSSGNFVSNNQNLGNIEQSAQSQVSEDSIEQNYKAPSVNELELENNEQQKNNLKDSYGNPVGITFEDSDQASANTHASSASEQSSEVATSALTSQGYAEAKHFGSSIEALASHPTLTLAQATDGSDGFQIQGSRGLYTLQIQPADGGLGTENSDGTIRHEQLLSNDLLQDIIAAIEQPQQNGPIQFQGLDQNRAIEQGYSSDLHHSASSAIVSDENANYRSQVKKDVDRQTSNASVNVSNNKAVEKIDKEKIALFVSNDYSDNSDSSSNKQSDKTDNKTSQ